MPSFKRRTKAEKRNRLKARMARQLKLRSGFPTRRNSLRFVEKLLTSRHAREGIGADWCDGIVHMIGAFRNAAAQIEAFTRSLNQVIKTEEDHRAKYPRS